MQLLVWGLNFKTVPVAIREQFAATQDSIRSALSQWDQYTALKEAVVLSTCNRSEVYAVCDDDTDSHVLQDFFLWHMVMRGGSPEKVLRLAEIAFEGEFDRATLIHWLRSYCRRFFAQQFKRSASADGPAVMGFTLSPRDGHKMPSDASNALWIGAVENMK